MKWQASSNAKAIRDQSKQTTKTQKIPLERGEGVIPRNKKMEAWHARD